MCAFVHTIPSLCVHAIPDLCVCCIPLYTSVYAYLCIPLCTYEMVLYAKAWILLYICNFFMKLYFWHQNWLSFWRMRAEAKSCFLVIITIVNSMVFLKRGKCWLSKQRHEGPSLKVPQYFYHIHPLLHHHNHYHHYHLYAFVILSKFSFIHHQHWSIRSEL